MIANYQGHCLPLVSFAEKGVLPLNVIFCSFFSKNFAFALIHFTWWSLFLALILPSLRISAGHFFLLLLMDASKNKAESRKFCLQKNKTSLIKTCCCCHCDLWFFLLGQGEDTGYCLKDPDISVYPWS